MHTLPPAARSADARPDQRAKQPCRRGTSLSFRGFAALPLRHWDWVMSFTLKYGYLK